MSDITARVTRRERIYKINEVGRAAIAKFLDPEYAFSLANLGPNDSVMLTVNVTISGGTPGENGTRTVNMELPASMVEEIA